MEPVTHALASLALDRAGLRRVSRSAAPMLLISGLVADADWVSRAAGAPAFLAWHRTASHSLLGAAAISVAVAAVFWWWHRRSAPERRSGYAAALAVCACGAGMHLLLDLTNDGGVQLLWPFRLRRFGWDLATEVDPLLLAILLGGLSLPALLNLVSEEIGARKQKRPGTRGALIAVALCGAYMGMRVVEQQRAAAMLSAHTYRNEAPLRTGVFPTAAPLQWRGVVETDTGMHEADVSVAPGTEFDARAARSIAKPDPSAAMQAAVESAAARTFLAAARFPMARVDPAADGVTVTIRDLREPAARPGWDAIVAVIAVNARNEVTGSRLELEADAPR